MKTKTKTKKTLKTLRTKATSIIAGIDYSMSCPAICIHDTGEWDFNKCKFYFIAPNKKYETELPSVKGLTATAWESQEERFAKISHIFLNIIISNSVDSVAIEGYSFASKGVVFNIGENTGMLKHRLYTHAIDFAIYSPGTIKKFASGKGNADKFKMNEAFEAEIGPELKNKLSATVGKSPLADLIDAYYICKLLHSENSKL